MKILTLEAGIVMGYKPSKWTKGMIIDGIRRHHVSGADLTFSRMRGADSRLVGAAIRHFGGWRQAVEAAGLDYNLVRRVGLRFRSKSITKWTPESIRREVRRLWELGRDVRASAVSARLPGLYAAARTHYRSWNAVLEAAGVSHEAANKATSAWRGWKRRWLRRLQAEAAGVVRGERRRGPNYRRAFRLPKTTPTRDWLGRPASDTGR